MSDDALPVGEDEWPLPFGVRAATGDLLPDLNPAALAAIGVDPKSVTDRSKPEAKVLAADESVEDPNDLAQAGWGVVIPADTPPAVIEALRPLLDRRQTEAGGLYKELGCNAGQKAPSWLSSKGVGLALVDPTKGVPLYLLLVGGPKQIPFDFQYVLDSYWNVGRLDFDTPDEYRAYAEAVVRYETDATVPTTKSSAIWVTKNPGDRATGLLHNQVGVPLVRGEQNHPPLGQAKGFTCADFLAEKATRANLEAILRGTIPTGRPSLLFTGSHGVAFDATDAGQREGQGALLSQAWEKGAAATADQYLRGADLPADTSVEGMIHFLFACYGGGCPAGDTYDRSADGKPVPLMPEPITARLPQCLLAKGALAVLAHIDRAWAFSFQNDRGLPQIQDFRSVMERLLAGTRIGQATDDFNRRWSVLAATLQMVVEEHAATGDVPPTQLANRWIARDDARNYLILGDPAVRLRVEKMAQA